MGFAPEGYADMTTNELVVNFFEVYLAAPIIVVSYVGYKLWFKTSFVGTGEIDLVTGVRDNYDELREMREMREADRIGYQSWSWPRRVYSIFC